MHRRLWGWFKLPAHHRQLKNTQQSIRSASCCYISTRSLPGEARVPLKMQMEVYLIWLPWLWMISTWFFICFITRHISQIQQYKINAIRILLYLWRKKKGESVKITAKNTKEKVWKQRAEIVIIWESCIFFVIRFYHRSND